MSLDIEVTAVLGALEAGWKTYDYSVTKALWNG